MTAELRIGLIGAGAVGSAVAASLLHNSLPFHWVVRNPVRRNQLDLLATEHDGQRRRFALPPGHLLASVEQLPALDWAILVVKAQQVEALCAKLPPGTPTLVVANGLHAGPFNLGVLYGGARLADSGMVLLAQSNTLWVGPLGLDQPRDSAGAVWLTRLLIALNSPWLTTRLSPDIRVRMWHKLALNCAVNPLTALLDRPNGELASLVDSPLLTGILREVEAVAVRELGEQAAEPVAQLQRDLAQLLEATAANSSSMREDLRLGRETEIRSLNLAVAELGTLVALPCPLNQALGNAVLSIEEANRRS